MNCELSNAVNALIVFESDSKVDAGTFPSMDHRHSHISTLNVFVRRISLFITKKYIFCDEKLSILQARKSTSRNNLIFSNTNWFCLKHWDQDQLLVEPFAIFPVDDRLEICQKNYMTGFLDPKLYTLKVHKLRLFLLKKKQRKCCFNITYFGRLFVRISLSV